MEAKNDLSTSSESSRETGAASFDTPFVRKAFCELIKIPVCEFQNALKDAFSLLLQDTEFNSKSSKHDFNKNFNISPIRQIFCELFKIQVDEFHKALINALIILAENVQLYITYSKKRYKSQFVINMFVFVMEIPMMQYLDYLEDVLPAFSEAASYLSVKKQAALACIWSTYQPDRLHEMLKGLQQLISHSVIHGRFRRKYCLHNKDMIIGATKFMKIIFYASLLGGEFEDEELTVPNNDTAKEDNQEMLFENNDAGEKEDLEPKGDDDKLGENDVKPSKENDKLVKERGHESPEEGSEHQNVPNIFLTSSDSFDENSVLTQDPLSVELNINTMDCWKPLLPFNEFYHELLSKHLETDTDFAFVGNPEELSFILTPEVKAMGLYHDNRIHMFRSRQRGDPGDSGLKLWVRRDHLIDDALIGLKMAAMESPNNFKKKLVVEFEGEQGVDAGGLSKEFFQLIVEEIFNADFAMFTLNPETHTYWFNPTTFENEEQFVLIGIILGLAIYNNVILDVHFPMVVYKKLMGKRGTFYDLKDWNPSLWKGLNDLLSYTEEDLEEAFLQSFCITYTDVFGNVLIHNLKGDGDLLVNQNNKKEFVRLYADFLLNSSISKQFQAFKRGFQMVTKDSLLHKIFRPEELEIVICGDKNFDFNALEQATKYDGGYSSESDVIKWFWESVHDFTFEQKRRLLQFTTGSDRIPVGGLSKLKLVIIRNGDDTDRLPTAHTCCNALLLPEYNVKEKLKGRLLKAIDHVKGFGLF